jgi:hypothetical protein
MQPDPQKHEFDRHDPMLRSNRVDTYLYPGSTGRLRQITSCNKMIFHRQYNSLYH